MTSLELYRFQFHVIRRISVIDDSYDLLIGFFQAYSRLIVVVDVLHEVGVWVCGPHFHSTLV